MEHVTACLITWKRPDNLGKIIPQLLKVPEIDEIIIEDNSKGENIINYARYKAARRAKNEYIYVQDDDALIGGLERIVGARNKDILTYGTQKGMQPEYFGDRHMALMGWGAVFNREHIKVLDKYLDAYGEDYCFYRETDRIFTVLLGGHHNPIEVEVTHLEGYKNEDALSSQPDHIKYKELAIQRCLKLVS